MRLMKKIPIYNNDIVEWEELRLWESKGILTSGEPLPNARNVTPAILYGSFNFSQIYPRVGEKYTAAVFPFF